MVGGMALAALLVAILGLVVATFSVGWQMAAWSLDGGRVRVRLMHAARAGASVVTGAIGRDSNPLDFSKVVGMGGLNQQLLGIEVTNVGRLRVRVSKYSAELWRGGLSFSPIGEAIGKDLPHWLEPGDSETWYAEMEDAVRLVDSMRSLGKPARGVQMTVTLGTGKKVTTRRHLDW
jgi:hypothetical protein